MMEPRKKILDGPRGRIARHIRRYVETDDVSGYLTDTVTQGLYTLASGALSQQTGTITARLDA